MAIRTIPAQLPVVMPSEISFGRPLRADVLRRFAQAQNYLWANVRRFAVNFAYDGEGRKVLGDTISGVAGAEDPAVVTIPGSTAKGLCVATFAIPSAQVGNTKIKVQGRADFVQFFGEAKIVVTIHEVDDDQTFTGILATHDEPTGGPFDFAIDEIEVPTNRPVVGKVWIGGALEGDGSSSDSLELLALSARWLPPEYFPSPGSYAFEHVDPSIAVAGAPASVWMLDMLRRQLLCLAGSKGQTEVLQAWFGETGTTGTSPVEVARYKVYVSAGVSYAKGRLWLFRGNRRGFVDVKWNGSTLETIDTGGQSDWTVQAYDLKDFSVTGDAEGVLTLEAYCDSDGAGEWGIDVIGVWAWELSADQGGWALDPGDYMPLDEGRLRADEILSADLEPNESARTGLEHLFYNSLWLQKNRLRSLVAEWRHRVLKRIADSNGDLIADPGSFWDWTPGGPAGNKPKNITIRGDTITADGWGRGPPFDDLDGYAASGTGFSDTGASSVASSWPASQAYRGHGRRLSALYLPVPSGLTLLASDATATTTFRARARRLRPAAFGQTFDLGALGPAVEEGNWKNRGSLEVDWPSTGGLSLKILSTAANVVDDHVPRWLPASSKLSYTSEGKIRGRCPIAFIPIGQANVLEGTLFEVELLACLAYEDPLTSSSLALLA